jgi:hypothetical protein
MVLAVFSFLSVSIHSCTKSADDARKVSEEIKLEQRSGGLCPPNDGRGLDVVACKSANGANFCVGLRSAVNKEIVITTYSGSSSGGANCNNSTFANSYSNFMPASSGLWEWLPNATPACGAGQFPIPANGTCFTVQLVDKDAAGNIIRVYSCYQGAFGDLPTCN